MTGVDQVDPYPGSCRLSARGREETGAEGLGGREAARRRPVLNTATPARVTGFAMRGAPGGSRCALVT